jgi:putative transcriptional regulator
MMSVASHAEEPEDQTASALRDVRPGSLLVSSIELVEPTFRRTVIYIIEHNDAGSLGVVINRPSETAVQNVLPNWSELAAKPQALYVGGPVKRDSALCLATLRTGVSIDGVPGLRRAHSSRVYASSPDTRAGRSVNSKANSIARTGWWCRRWHPT